MQVECTLRFLEKKSENNLQDKRDLGELGKHICI